MHVIISSTVVCYFPEFVKLLKLDILVMFFFNLPLKFFGPYARTKIRLNTFLLIKLLWQN
jgi:hypothetical protein